MADGHPTDCECGECWTVIYESCPCSPFARPVPTLKVEVPGVQSFEQAQRLAEHVRGLPKMGEATLATGEVHEVVAVFINDRQVAPPVPRWPADCPVQTPRRTPRRG